MKSKADKYVDRVLVLMRNLQFACFRAGVEGLPGFEYSQRAMDAELDLVGAIGKYQNLIVEDERTRILAGIKNLERGTRDKPLKRRVKAP